MDLLVATSIAPGMSPTPAGASACCWPRGSPRRSSSTSRPLPDADAGPQPQRRRAADASHRLRHRGCPSGEDRSRSAGLSVKDPTHPWTLFFTYGIRDHNPEAGREARSQREATGPAGVRRLLLIAVVGTASIAIGGTVATRAAEDPVTPAPAATANAPDEQTPVAVPEPTERAMRFYRGNNALWAFNQVWAILRDRRHGLLGPVGADAQPGPADRAERVLHRRDLRHRLSGHRLRRSICRCRTTRASSGCTPTACRTRPSASGLAMPLVRLAVSMVVGFALTWVPYLR